jgi:hypothetical protein
MSITGTVLENVCKFLLQKNIRIEAKDKLFKQGKVILFYQKNFYITLVMDTQKKKNEKIEIPIPFDIEFHQKDHLVYFDYRIKTLAKFAPEIETNLIVYPKKNSKNKFWNSIILIDASYE